MGKERRSRQREAKSPNVKRNAPACVYSLLRRKDIEKNKKKSFERNRAMNELSMEAFERRATEAEDRLSLLAKKLASKASGGGVSEDMICNLLAVLYEVRGTLGKEKNNQMLSE